MKAFLLLMLVVLSSCEDYCTVLYAGKSAEECNKLTKTPGVDYCCWFHYKESGGEINVCYPINKEVYEKIGEFVDALEKEYPNASDIKFDCSSKYLSVALITLLLVLF